MLSILGAGSFGVALAAVVSRALEHRSLKSKKILLWARRPERCHAWETSFGDRFPDVCVTHDLPFVLKHTSSVIYAMPAQVLRDFTVNSLKGVMDSTLPFLIASKGIEKETGLLLHEVLSDIGLQNPLAFLSGPHLAKELIALKPSPTIGVLGGARFATSFFQQTLSSEKFILEITENITAVALAAAFKNVMAVCSGLMRGEGVLQNTQSAILAKGIALMDELTVLFGGTCSASQFPALLGDYMLTTHSQDSRNTSAGVLLGEGRTLNDLATAPLAEGTWAMRALQKTLLNRKKRVVFIDALCARIFEQKSMDWCALLKNGFEVNNHC